jgi:hypothetical protein
MDLRVRRETAAQRNIYISDLINLDPSFNDDPEIVSMVLEYRRELTRAASLPRGSNSREESPTHYTGPEICVQCHASRHRFWARTRHAKAYETLGEKESGLNPDCLPCHVTGFGKATGYRPDSERDDMEGVTCESCHGIGSLHVMSPELYDLVGTPPVSLCRKCHTDEQDDDFHYIRDKGIVCSEEM